MSDYAQLLENAANDEETRQDHSALMCAASDEITRLQAQLDEANRSHEITKGVLARQVTRRTKDQAKLDEAKEKLNKVVHCVSDLIDNSDGVYGLHLNGDPTPWNSLLKGGRDEGWMIDFSEVAYTAIPPTNKGADTAPQEGEG